MGRERKKRIVLGEMLLVDTESYFFELNRFCQQLHVFALGMEALTVNDRSLRAYFKPDKEEDLGALCKTAWQLLGKVRGLVHAWDQLDPPKPKQITQGR